MPSASPPDTLAEAALAGRPLARDEALGVLTTPDEELPALLQAAYRVRRRHHGNRVKVHVLMNAKRGNCPEDCAFCAQSSRASGELEPYALGSPDEIVAEIRRQLSL